MDAVREYIDDRSLLPPISEPKMTIAKPELSHLGCRSCNFPCPHGSVNDVRSRYKGSVLEGICWTSLSDLAEGKVLTNFFQKKQIALERLRFRRQRGTRKGGDRHVATAKRKTDRHVATVKRKTDRHVKTVKRKRDRHVETVKRKKNRHKARQQHASYMSSFWWQHKTESASHASYCSAAAAASGHWMSVDQFFHNVRTLTNTEIKEICENFIRSMKKGTADLVCAGCGIVGLDRDYVKRSLEDMQAYIIDLNGDSDYAKLHQSLARASDRRSRAIIHLKMDMHHTYRSRTTGKCA